MAMHKAREMLKMELIGETSAHIDGAIAEIVSYPNGAPGGFLWVTGESFHRGDAPLGFDLTDMKSGQPWLENIQMAMWFFGPSQVQDPGYVYRWLNDHMENHAPLYMTTEIPWRGNMPNLNEYGQYVDEEIHAALVRSGFDQIRHSVDGPYFRFWAAAKSASTDHRVFQKVESQLAKGNWRVAVEALGELDDSLESLAAVREYALLLAACHDLAGNTRQSYTALTEALRMDPDCARAMCGLGRLAALNNDMDGAMLFFESALKKSPCMVAALRGRAVVCEMMGDLQTAYEDMMDASNFRPFEEDLILDVVRLGNSLGHYDEIATWLAERNALTAASAEAQKLTSTMPTRMPNGEEAEVRASC